MKKQTVVEKITKVLLYDLTESILWWVIYLLAWYKGGFLFGVIIGTLTMIHGFIRYYKGGEFLKKLYEISKQKD